MTLQSGNLHHVHGVGKSAMNLLIFKYCCHLWFHKFNLERLLLEGPVCDPAWSTCSITWTNALKFSITLRPCQAVQELQNKHANNRYIGVVDTNHLYGGANPNTTHVFYSDFSDDPWQRASVNRVKSHALIEFSYMADNPKERILSSSV